MTFQNVEHLGPTREDSKVIFDVPVRTSNGEEFIVEMQLGQQKYFKDRALYYLSYPILGQGALAKQKGRRKASVRKPFRWNYELKPVKLIAILNFSMEHEEGRWERGKYHSSYSLREDTTGELMSDRLQLIFLELGRFNKKEDELETWYDKWMYLFKNIAKSECRIKTCFDYAERQAYMWTRSDQTWQGLRADRKYSASGSSTGCLIWQKSEDMDYSYQNTIDFAEEKGAHKKALQIAEALRASGVSEDVITQCTGLSAEELRKL